MTDDTAMQVQVHHVDEPTFRADANACTFPTGFTLVATFTYVGSVDAALGWAFQLTNHIDHAWHETGLVECRVERPRSTSVGDVVVVDGSAHLCAPAGWLALPPTTRVTVAREGETWADLVRRHDRSGA